VSGQRSAWNHHRVVPHRVYFVERRSSLVDMAHGTFSQLRGSRPLPKETIERLRLEVGTDARRTSLARFGLSFNTMARCLAGLPVHSATAVVVEQALRKTERSR
jgi:hypothetical protein